MNIAARYNGEIINGDAMQVYEGLPIITNKMPVEERKGIPHHLLGRIGLSEPTWTVSDFVSHALETIKEIRRRGKLPILVGGTHYYTQSLLFHDALAEKEEEDVSEEGEGSKEIETSAKWPILDASTEEILARLREVDPVMADRWHPKDHRKIRRSLEIHLQTGRKASEIYEQQRARREKATHTEETEDDLTPTSHLRTRTLILWVHSTTTTLTTRLNARVDKMLTQGLLHEVRTLSDLAIQLAQLNAPLDQTRGIWVSIGYKEFLAYQTALRDPTTTPTEHTKLLLEAIDKTKAATRQYAKRQIRWIRIKLLHAISSAGAKDSFFLLDGSDLSTWDASVSSTGLSLVEKFLRDDEPLPDPLSLSPLAREMLRLKREDMSANQELWRRRHCEVCDMTAVTESDWSQHVRSKRHRIAVKKARFGETGLERYLSEKERRGDGGGGEEGEERADDKSTATDEAQEN